MSAISTYAFGASNSKFLKMSIYVEARTTAAQTVFIDDVILRQKEP